MSTISEYLKAEIIDPTLPRDSFVPPPADDEYEDVDLDDIVDIEQGDDDE